MYTVSISLTASLSPICFLFQLIIIPKAKRQIWIEKEQKREFHELPYTEIDQSRAIRLAAFKSCTVLPLNGKHGLKKYNKNIFEKFLTVFIVHV